MKTYTNTGLSKAGTES